MNIRDVARKWWKEAVVYQVYPRSFKDSNGDGIGDLGGIISKLDYLQSLGITVVWLNPVYASPNEDNGYDICDYLNIMAECGTMADFDTLLKGLHERGIKLVMDLVVNHTSDQHEWFIESRKSRDNPYRDYYIWRDAEKGKPAHRASFFDDKGDAWRFDETTNAYYYHIFSAKQPDLNWDSEAMRKDIYKMIAYWFDKGVDGFRMDAVSYISKDSTFPFIPEDVVEKEYGEWACYYAQGPHLHEYLQEMNREVLSKYDIMTVAEGSGLKIEQALDFVAEDRNELNMLYHFDGMGVGLKKGEWKVPDPEGVKLTQLKEVYSKWDAVFEEKGWGTIYLGNHDQPRMVTRWGNDSPAFRQVSAKMLFTFLLSMRGTPFVYNGDEIGMTNIRFNNIEQYNDLETRHKYEFIKLQGGDLQAFIEAQKLMGRDNSRTPFQWDDSMNAGFSSGKPWLPVNDNYTTINAAEQEQDPNSILHYFRKLIQLRKDKLVLVYGRYELLDAEHEQVYCYTRTLDEDKILVLLNFSPVKLEYQLAEKMTLSGKVLINNYASFNLKSDTFMLEPYQALVLEVAS